MIVYRYDEAAGVCRTWHSRLQFVVLAPWVFCWAHLGKILTRIRTEPEHIARFPGRVYEVGCERGIVEWEQELSLELGIQLVKEGADPYATFGPNSTTLDFIIREDWLRAWRSEYNSLPMEKKGILFSALQMGVCPVCSNLVKG